MMDWWHRRRAEFWELEHLYCVGWLDRATRIGTVDQFEYQMTKAKQLIAEGKCRYHRLKAGMSL